MKTNLQTRTLITELKVAGKTVPLWKRVADELEASSRRMTAVNISKLNKFLGEGEIALVPGKVLSLGDVSQKMTVAAFSYSESARMKIAAKGEALSIAELLKKNPKGKNVRIVK